MARTVVSPAVAFTVPAVFVAPAVSFRVTQEAETFTAEPVLFANDLPDGHWVTWEGRHLFIPAGGKGENN